jgi:drug/metabolite transporter (DMT)-like permease
MVRAFELAPAPFVSPFNYGQLIGATVLSVVVFGQLPDVWVWAGALVIAGSGVLMLWAERHVRRQLPAHSICEDANCSLRTEGGQTGRR